MLKPHIVILGAGFGGTYVAKKLAHFIKSGLITVTIVNKTNYFLFTPLLHEVATGSLGPLSVAEPLREIFRNDLVELCQGAVESVDITNHCVHIHSIGENSDRHTLKYDYLVMATGAETNYYAISGAQEFSLPLKSLSDAVSIRTQAIDAFEEAIMSANIEERKKKISFAVVGGGPTGVELVSELAEFIRGMVERYYSESNCPPQRVAGCKREEPTISLIDGGNDILMQVSPNLRKIALERLKKLGINIYLGNRVTAISPHGVELADGKVVSANNVFWTAGVKPSVPNFDGYTPELLSGRIVVDEFLRLPTDERVFVFGDVATITQKPLPMLAQVTTQQAGTVAYNILASLRNKKLRTFKYRSKGTLVSVGQWFAVGEIFSMQISGKFAWWLWRTIYLFKFASWKKRFRIAFDWTFNIFNSRDITKLG